MSTSTIDLKRIGRDILYCLGTFDAAEIIRARRAAGNATQHGNDPKAGQWLPGKIVADFGSTRADWEHIRETHRSFMTEEQLAVTYEETLSTQSVNVQVQLDGNDTYWATSRQEFNPDTMGRHVLPNDVAGPNDTGAVEADYSPFWVPDPEGHWIFA